MRDRYPRLLDSFVFLGVLLGDATMLLIFTASGFLALWCFDATNAELAYVGAAYWLFYAPLSPLWARLGGRIGPHRMAVIAGAGVLLATLLLPWVRSVWELVAAIVLLGVAASAMWPNIEAELARGREGPLLRRRLTVFNVMWTLGLLVGPLLGMWIYPEEAEARGPDGRQLVNLAFYTASILAAGMLACLAAWRPRVPPAAEVQHHLRQDGGRDPVQLRAFWLMAFVANFMCYVVLGVVRHLYENLASHQWADQQEASARLHALLAIMAAAGAITYGVLYFAHRWHYRLKRHLAWQAILAGGLLLVALAGADLVRSVVGFIIIGIGTSFIYSASLFYSMEGKDQSSHMAGWHEAVLAAGSLFGLLLTGHVPELLALCGVTDEDVLVRSPYVAAVVIFAIGIVVQWAIHAAHRPRFAARA
jgi:MFS family permease